MSAILKRELKAYFTTPLGYVILAVMAFFLSSDYIKLFEAGLADMSYVFKGIFTVIFFLIPIVTMRLFAEDKKQKTDQLLLTSPVKITGIVMGKYIAAVSFFSIILVFMLIFNIIISLTAGVSTDWVVFAGNEVGLLLFAASFISIGLFISSLTESQVVAAVGCFAVSFFLMILENDLVNMFKAEWFRKAVEWFSFNDRYVPFTKGIFSLSNFIFFISVNAVFIFLTIRVIDKKRWA